MTVVERPGSASSQIPKRVWALGFVSMLMVVSSGMIHALLPLFLVASMVTVAIIEGIAQAPAQL